MSCWISNDVRSTRIKRSSRVYKFIVTFSNDGQLRILFSARKASHSFSPEITRWDPSHFLR